MGAISEIIVHIGLEKTGTTSIQMFLDDHQAMLRQQGVFASGCLGWYNHKLLAAYGMADGSRDVAVTSAGIYGAGIDGPAAHRAFRVRTRGHVLAEIARIESERADIERPDLERADLERAGATRYLLSSEDLSRLTTIDDVRRVHALLSEICANIRVVVFLRRQDLLAVSRYYSWLINADVPPAVFPAPDQAAYYDYAALLDTWAQVFGDAAIRIVHYPDTKSHGGFDAIGAFCKAAGIALPPDWQGKVRQDNVSLDVVSQTILETVNRHGGILTEKLPAKRLLDALRAVDGGVGGGIADQFVNAAQARAFYDRFALGNARLVRRFALPQPLFGDDFSMYPETPPPRGDLAQAALERMVDVVATLLARQPRRA